MLRVLKRLDDFADLFFVVLTQILHPLFCVCCQQQHEAGLHEMLEDRTNASSFAHPRPRPSRLPDAIGSWYHRVSGRIGHDEVLHLDLAFHR
jgi:hypothetical protein